MVTLVNTNPLGEVDVPLVGRILAADEEFEVSAEVAAVLLEQVGNFAPKANLDDLTVDQLRDLANERGADPTGATKKAEIVAALTKKKG